MALIVRLAVLALGSWLAQAAPTPDDIALASKYAPQWKFHSAEIYWPSTVEFFFTGVKQVDGSGNVINGAVTSSNVDDAPNQGSGDFLNADIPNGKNGFLRGQNPSSSSPAVYTFIAPKANGVVDIFYWLFTPFNQGKNVLPGLVGEVGDHVGDWERMTVRTVNGVATQVDYHAHSDDGSGTIPFDQVPKFDNGQRPVGYVALGSHGFWSSAGSFTYVNAVIFQLKDETNDGGVAWDTRDSLVSLHYPDTFSGDLDWLNYKGVWGNNGETDCWWHFIYSECEIVTGPGGPLRDDVLGAAVAKTNGKSKMDGPLSQTLGTVSKDSKSTFTLYISDGVHSTASQQSYSRLAVTMTCNSTAQREDKEEPATSTTFATVELTKDAKFTLTPAACGAGFEVTSYTVGLCADDTTEDCLWSTSSRKLRAFSSDTPGIQSTTAIDVTDVDTWDL